jgi:hypothetical protein
VNLISVFIFRQNTTLRKLYIRHLVHVSAFITNHQTLRNKTHGKAHLVGRLFFTLHALKYIILYIIPCKVKVKAIPLQAWTDPEGSRSLRLPDFEIVGT